MKKRRLEATNYAKVVGSNFDFITSFFVDIWGSQYINVGYWEKKTTSIKEAQLNLVKVFGSFSKLKKDIEVIDVGCGTGEQDLFYMEQYKCKHILGMNVSKTQIRTALDKIARNPRYSANLTFRVEDAHNLLNYSQNYYDRVLALECTQYFDKRIFLQGAYHVLKQGGYLSTAEIILIKKSRLDIDKIIFEMDKEVTDEYKPIVSSLVKSCVGEFEHCYLSKKHVTVTYDNYLKLLKKEGFLIEEVRDITSHVLNFYPTIKNTIGEILNKSSKHPNAHLLLATLIAQYILHILFKSKSIGFYLVRVIKS